MKRILAILLALLAMGTTLASCGGGGEAVATTAATQPAETTDATHDENGFLLDDLPDDLNFNGEEFSALIGDYMEAYALDLWVEEETGNAFSDSVYAARTAVEERLNTKMKEEVYYFVWNNRAEFFNRVQSLVMAGDDTYDGIWGYSLVSLFTSGNYFRNLTPNKYIDISKPWWTQSVQDLLPSRDSVYFLTGDGTTSLIKHSFALFFSEEQLTNYGIKDNLYDLVREGKWTMDKLLEFASVGYVDLNGDGAKDIEDHYGLTFSDQNKLLMIPATCQVDMYERTDDGGRKFVMGNEHAVDVEDYFYNMFQQDYVLKPVTNKEDPQTIFSFSGNYIDRAFCEDRSIFCFSLVGDAQYILENSSFTLGLVPAPKWNEEQDNYYTCAQRFAHFYIPVSANNYDMSGAVMEAWSSQCYRQVMPVFYETNLKTRYSTNTDMTEMFDLIKGSIITQFGTVFSLAVSPNCDNFKNFNDGGAWTTLMASKAESAQKTVDDLVAALRNMEG